MISVIVPIYNASRVLARCINSVLLQSYSNFELILVNDGSKDNSLDICKEYSLRDNRIKVVSQNNCGVSNARNNGLETARGEWVIFLDSDDELLPTILESMYNLIEEDNQIICCSSRKSNGDIFTEFNFASFCVGEGYSAGSVLLFGAPWGKLYNADIIKKHNIRFKSNIAKNEDTIFFWEYMKYVNRISTTPEIGYVYYVSESPQSLHNKLVEPSLIFQTRVLLRDEFEDLRKKWLIDESSLLEIQNWLSSFYIDALISSYRLLKPRSERKNIYITINREELQLYYKPKSLNEKKILSLLYENSFFKTDIYLCYKYYMRSLLKSLLFQK